MLSYTEKVELTFRNVPDVKGWNITCIYRNFYFQDTLGDNNAIIYIFSHNINTKENIRETYEVWERPL